MTLSSWATDLTDIYVGGAGTFTALGGGAAGLNTETDYFIQGTDCKSKNAWTNAIKGLIHDNGSSFTVPSNGAIIAWLYYAAVNALEVINPGGSPNNGGLMMIEGSSASDYNRYNIGGSDTLTFDSWVPYVVDPNFATANDSVGTPSGTEQFVGVEANLPTTSGPTKGAPIAIDAVRYGRCVFEYLDGDTGPVNDFDTAEAYGNATTRRWGLLEKKDGAFFAQGHHSFGTASTPVTFEDDTKTVFIRDTHQFAQIAFNRFEILNASSDVAWDNITFQGLGGASPGTFVHTAGAFTATDCQFVDCYTFSLLSSSVMTDCTWRECYQITAPGSDLSGSSIIGSHPGVSPNDSSVIWDVNTDPVTNMDGMTFDKTIAAAHDHHAIEFGTNSPLTMTLNDCTFLNYSGTNNVNSSTFHIKRTTGTVTINITGTGTPASSLSYRTDGATVIIQQQVTVTFDELKDNTEVRVYLNSTGAELTGIENATAGSPDNRNFPATIDAATVVDYVIHNVGYEYIRVEAFTWPSVNQTLIIQQRLDRNFENPA
jgi:hypothetical protein